MEEALYNLNIERAVLNSIIFDATLFDDVHDVINHNDFYLPAHAAFFKAMEALHQAEQPLDEVFIKKHLLQGDEKSKNFDENAMLEILSANPISNTTAYVRELKDKAMKRHLIAMTSEIKRVAIDEDMPGQEVADIVEARLFEITQDNAQLDFRDAPDITESTMAYIEEMRSRGDSILVGVDTGFADLNKKTTGFGPGDLIILAARPAMGKTAFALNVMLNLVNKGEGVAFFSLEMPAEQLMLRLLAAKTSIPLQKLRVGDMDENQWKTLTDAKNHLAKQPIFVDDQGSVNINQLKSKLRKLKMKNPEIKMAIVDYLQIMASMGNKSRVEEVSEISRGLKMLARELKMPIIALSQLNRGLEARADKRPMLSDIRESGAIEQDADIILFVYRDDVYKYKEEKEKEKEAAKEGKEYVSDWVEKEEEDAEIIIGKQRNGPTGFVKLKFHKKFTKFVNHTGNELEISYENVDTRSASMDVPPTGNNNEPISETVVSMPSI